MSVGAFSLDQLMELAGLSVSQAATMGFLTLAAHQCPANSLQTTSTQQRKAGIDSLWTWEQWLDTPIRVLTPTKLSLVGGDGLVAGRHLWHYGYQPTIYYPKQSKNDLYQRLAKQLKDLNIPFTDDFQSAIKSTDHIVDAIFGFSFEGEVREPFPSVIEALKTTPLPVTSVDAPSSWNIEDGPPSSGPGKDFHPAALVSLTAPKPLVKWFKGRHFVGGRFVTPQIATKYDLDVPRYEGVDQVVEIDVERQNFE
ncbi:MAG: hypothetical protein M1836_001020 [Candelina mexicana]|nr:MAG: hypothetical protein M1836_001020 [Candelina mexicana]